MTSGRGPNPHSSYVGSFRAKPNEGHKLTPISVPILDGGQGL